MSGFVLIGFLIQLAVLVCVVVYAIKLLNRITEISSAQKSIAESQAELVRLLARKESLL